MVLSLAKLQISVFSINIEISLIKAALSNRGHKIDPSGTPLLISFQILMMSLFSTFVYVRLNSPVIKIGLKFSIYKVMR